MQFYNRPRQLNRSFSSANGLNLSLLGLLMAGGGFLAGRSIIRHLQANRQQNLSIEEGSYATLAKQIKMSFDNDGYWGTDKDQLRAAVTAIASKQDFAQVVKSYQKMYHRNLLADMQSELKSTEYNEMIAIVSAKPERRNKPVANKTLQYTQWAKRLRAAFDIHYGIFPGTDEPAIRAVFNEIPSQSDFNAVGSTYKTLYGTALTDDLKRELEMWEISSFLQIIDSKPKY